MKEFYLNVLSLMAIVLVILIVFDYLSMVGWYRIIFANLTNSSTYITVNVGSDEIKPYIEKVQTQDGTTKLIIGDSVCHQMFENLQEFNSDFSIAGSNAAITMTGQYILAKEYLDSHPYATDIFLIVLPDSLGRTFDTMWGYQYTVMPFVETDTLKFLDEETIQAMESVYGEFFMRPSVVTAIDLSGVNRKLYLNLLNEYSSGYSLQNHFELADQYVYKIYKICQERGVGFHLYPCPVSENSEEYVNNLKSAFEESLIYSINPEYLDSVYYFSAEETKDGVHFSGDFANQECFNEKIRLMFEGKEILEMLKFE